MILLKSFFNKKTTKIYIIILVIISLIFIIGQVGKNKLINIVNDNYAGSIIAFNLDENNLEELKKIDNISNVYESALVNVQNLQVLFSTYQSIGLNNELSEENGIIIPSIYKDDEHKIGDKINFEINNLSYEFTIEGYFDSHNYSYMFIIHSSVLSEILKNNIQDNAYVINLKNWAFREKTMDQINNDLNVEYIIVNIVRNHNVNVDYIIIVFDVIMNIIFCIFIIITLITFINVIIDEEKNNLLYKSMGYSKMLLFFITLGKLLILFFIMLIPLFCFLKLK